MKNTIKVLGIIALVAVIGFSMAVCDDSGGDDNGGNQQGGVGVTVTVSIEKINASTFTVTLEGSKWFSGFGESNNDRNIFTEATRSVTVTANGSDQSLSTTWVFSIAKTSDDTVATFTLKDGYSNVRGTIALNPSSAHAGGILGLTDVDQNKTNTLIINPAKASITF